MKDKIVFIVDYGVGNLFNIQRAFDAVGVESKITTNVKDIEQASHLVLPGVGSFQEGISQIKKSGLFDAVVNYANSDKPLLGICLGMQLLMDQSFEGGITEGFGFIGGEVVQMKKSSGIKIPHIGWSMLNLPNSQDIEGTFFEDLEQDTYMYFLHSYMVQVENPEHDTCLQRAEKETGFQEYLNIS